MHQNYHFIKQLALRLHSEIAGKVFVEAFSQQKDELIIVFAEQTENEPQDREQQQLIKPFFIKATLTNSFSCLSFPERFDRARRNSVNLFHDFAEDRVEFVKVCSNERAIQVHFESGRDLIFKLFGNRSNFIALNEEGEVTQLFNNKLSTDRGLTVASLNREIDQSWEAFVANDGRFEPLFPTFGKVANKYLSGKLAGKDDLAERWAIVQEVLREFESSVFYITKIENIPALTLFETGEVVQVLHDPIEALNAFYLAYIRLSGLDKEKADIVRLLKKRIQQTDNYLENTFQKLVDLENATKNDELANIIMANLHVIPERAEKVELYDFYRDQPITIKLKKDLSAQKNAEGYYRKAKNEKIEIDRLNDSLAAREADRKRLQEHLEHIGGIELLRDLRAYIKTNKLEQGSAAPTIDDLFKRLDFMGYTILIGRNAKNSDLLTKQAHKEDLWLHAKDVTGSHVVVKNQPGRKFPAPVIERAAELAAFYSKRKNDSLCPVIVTPKKFIRKPKGLPDGLVLIDKEDIVMVVAKGE
ncbi:NFACT RNA binding domain-containing protein [Dyadobacter jiangsuensis]|uniref:Putative ribosome quality control (RQC) complex YloA/Tae2 family protein n=1 Tax=Dyadobacter jiangsuensis TaxID=1591085 RepID=A0A2P8G1F9_9BACT|nr:NFACT RNA binding domain-containing protein [Dyadobacter jiangsuensis]PSL27822.1 putative ribosome quality control (RQC) complex YloA/Tae2 family protein [Dyadobacter jiangsuensis]